MQTYNEILDKMSLTYEKLTGVKPDKTSDMGIRFAVLAGELFAFKAELSWLKAQMFPTTAEGDYLDLHAKQRGLSRKTGKKAVGYVDFGVSEPLSYEISIPKGTICATRGSDPIKFSTKADAVLAAGKNSITVAVEALTEGVVGNVRVGTIVDMVTPVPGIESIRNLWKLTGGSNAETDEELRARIIDSFVSFSNGTNKSFYINSAMEVEGVTAVGVIPKNRGAGTVDVFITDAQRNPSEELIDEVQQKLNKLREINVDVMVKKLHLSPVNVYVDITVKRGYEKGNVINACRESIGRYFAQLEAGAAMYLSDLGDYIKHTDGVKNYTFKELLMSDYFVEDDCLIVANAVYVNGSDE